MKSRAIVISTLMLTMLFGALTSGPASALGDPYAEISLSNQRPNVGDPIAIYLDLYDCSIFPTDISVELSESDGPFSFGDPFATLTNKSTGYKVKKVGSVFKIQWLYRGPIGDGVTSARVAVSPNATGGCVTDTEQFVGDSEWANWIPSPVTLFGHNVFSIETLPDTNGLKIWWQSDNSYVTDESNFFEIQDAIAGTNNWSRSIVTADSKYFLTGLAKFVHYDVRIRASDKNGTGPWSTSDRQNTFRTPASFTATSQTTDGTPTRTFATGDTIKFEIELDDCTVDPSNPSGSLNYIVWAADTRQNQNQLFGTGIADNTGFIYDAALESYKGALYIPSLPDGAYYLYNIFFGNCGWTYGPESLAGPIYGNFVEFTVGPKVAQVPNWGSGYMSELYSSYRGVFVTAQSSSSATLSWGRPVNVEDGPFTYTVEQLKSDGSVSKILGTTKNYTFNISGLSAATDYRFRVLASNSATTNSSLRPSVVVYARTANLTVKRGSKLSAAAYAKAIGAVVPAGATVTIAKPAGTFLFADCTFAKNIVTFKNSVGACSVQLTIKPKKVGKKQPKSIVSLHDVMIKK